MPRGVPKSGFRKTKKFLQKIEKPVKVTLASKKSKKNSDVSQVTSRKNTTSGPFILLDLRGKNTDVVSRWDSFPTNEQLEIAWATYSKKNTKSQPFFMVPSVFSPFKGEA